MLPSNFNLKDKWIQQQNFSEQHRNENRFKRSYKQGS